VTCEDGLYRRHEDDTRPIDDEGMYVSREGEESPTECLTDAGRCHRIKTVARSAAAYEFFISSIYISNKLRVAEAGTLFFLLKKISKKDSSVSILMHTRVGRHGGCGFVTRDIVFFSRYCCIYVAACMLAPMIEKRLCGHRSPKQSHY